jgi:hypothetical protein
MQQETTIFDTFEKMNEKINKKNNESKENIWALLAKIDFGQLTPEDSRAKTIMLKVDKDVHALFSKISDRKGLSMKALGNWCILDFLQRCKRDEDEI